MTLDPLSPVAPARVRCLLVPCGRITRPRFLDFLKRLQKETTVRLRDVTPQPAPDSNTFSPLAFQLGVVLYDLTVAEPSPGQRALYPFELSREPWVVLGISDAAEYSSSTHGGQAETKLAVNGDSGGYNALLDDLSVAYEDLRAEHNVALVHRILLFDQDEPLKMAEGVVTAIHSPSKSTSTTIKTLMCDVTSYLLSQMAPYARSIQSVAAIETPRQSMPDGYMRPTSDAEPESKRQSWFPSSVRSSSPNFGLSRLAHRASLPAHLFSSSPSRAPSPSDETPRSGATSPNGEPATTFDQIQLQEQERRRTAFDGGSFAQDPAAERARLQTRSRISIVLGAMYLVAGRWPDAMRELIHGGTVARSGNDHIWHAKAVDLIVVTILMCAWAGVEFEVPPLCLPIAERSSMLLGRSPKKGEPAATEIFVHGAASKDTRRENLQKISDVLPEITQHIIRLYTRSTAEHVSQLVISETFIRLSKLSTINLFFPGLSDGSAMDAIVLNQKLRISPAQESIGSLASPVRAEIAAVVSAAIPPEGLQQMIQYGDRLTIHAGAAAVLGMLGYHRKKAFVLRELLGFLVQALEQDAARESFDLSAHTPAALTFPIVKVGSTSQDEAAVEQNTEIGSIYNFLLLICQVYGAVIVKSLDAPAGGGDAADVGDAAEKDGSSVDQAALLAARIEEDSIKRRFGNRRLKMDVLFACMTVCEIVPDLSGAISFAGSLLRTVSSGTAPGPKDVDGAPILGADEQARLADAVHSAAATATELGIGKIEAEYWDDFLVRDIDIMPTAPDLALTPRKRSELAAVKQTLAKNADGPFIVNQFNPRLTASKREQFLVQGEKFSFTVLLQNLYDIDLDIESLEIDAEGPRIEGKAENVTIGPYRTHRLRLVAQALGSGKLTVRGCLIKIRDCEPRMYPIFRDSWRPKEENRIKRQGLASIVRSTDRPSSTASDMIKSTFENEPSSSTLEAKVVRTQPRLLLTSTTIVQENIIILDGQREQFSLTVKNVSEETISFLALSFDDSTLSILQAAVQDRELPAADLYEVEYGMYKKAALRWLQPDGNVHIAPGEERRLEVEVLGKPGLTSGTVFVDYASIEGDSDSGNDEFYTRRLSIPFAITVNPSVDLVNNDVLALTGPLAERDPGSSDSDVQQKPSDSEWVHEMLHPFQQEPLVEGMHQEYCLLLLDFYNSWSSPLTVTPQLSRSKEGADDWHNIPHLEDNVPPGKNTRLLIPVPRMNLQDPYAPIPSLSSTFKRQFVVSSSKMSESYEKSSRDAFWHREEILKRLRVKWLDNGSGRSGLVELRTIRLTTRMLDALKVESLSITLAIEAEEHVKKIGPAYFKATTDEFLTVCTKVTNRSNQPIHPLLRIQPNLRNQPYNIALDISRKFAFTGVLQQPLPLLQPGESADVSLDAVFLCSGEFEIGASVEEIVLWKPPDEVKGSRQRSGSVVDLDILSNERVDRRIWIARELCKVDVEDSPDDEMF